MGPLILGIDAGGSKTVACLGCDEAAPNAKVIGRGTAGPANPRSIGVPQTLAHLSSAGAAAFADAGIPPQPIAAGVLAAAGSDSDENRRVLSRWAEETLRAERFQIVHDAWPVLAAGTSDGYGIALISGTGSIAFGRAADGRTARAGGWGYLFGDEGSGYALALAGLRAAAQAADGRSPPTRLLAAFLDHFRLERPESLVATVYPLANDRQAIAALAGIVLDAAAAGDAAAATIVAHAARDLAAMIAAVAKQLEWRGAVPLALSGGVLIHRPILCDELLIGGLRALGISPGPITVVSEPVLGALKLAGDLLDPRQNA